MISNVVSIDIIKYLQEEKNLSINEISQFMGTTVNHINDILETKQVLTSDNITFYLKYSGLHFWEFAIKAIPLDHLTKKARNRILLCQKLSEHIKKNNKK